MKEQFGSVSVKLVGVSVAQESQATLSLSVELPKGKIIEFFLEPKDAQRLVSETVRAAAQGGQPWALDIVSRYGGLL